MSNMDDILSHIGLGWFQVPPIATALLIQGSYATQHVATVFTDMPRNFNCSTSVDDVNSTSFNNLCWIRNISDTSVMGNKEHLCTDFVYDTTLFKSTFSSEFNLVCEGTWLSGLFKTAGFAGVLFGCLFTGMGDKWGRVSVIHVITFLYLISVLVVGLVPEMKSVIVARFIVGFCHEILNAASYTLLMEVLPLSHRSTVGAIVVNISYVMFAIITGTISYFIRSWRTLHLTLSFPIYLLFVCMFFLHKSPRWLIHSGNIEEGINALKKGAKLNHIKLSDESLEKFKTSTESCVNKSNEEAQINTCEIFYSMTSLLKMLFGTVTMRTISITFPAVWFLTGFIYFSIILNANNFTKNNPFLYVAVIAIAESPANMFIPILLKYLGNVKTISMMFILTMASLISAVFVPEYIMWLKWGVILLAMMAISSSYMIAFILGSELFPTPVRSVGFGMGSIARHTGALTAQYIIGTASVVGMWWLPNAVGAVCCLIASAISLGLLPETHGRPLCETIEQLENSCKEYTENKNKNKSSTHF